MNFWSEIVGQAEAVATLDHAASPTGASELSHAWLITGPPGSGRYNLALRFAAALVSRETSDQARAEQYALVAAGTHPDVTLVRTQTTELGVKQMREAVAGAYFAPSVSPHRVIVIEDADRMNASAANATLKALEEPPETTVWILCAPSEADLLPTIRSRTRVIRLQTPQVAEVAQLLTERDGVDPARAHTAAQLAQGHIGMAKRLATDPAALTRRQETISAALSVNSLPAAMRTAMQLHEIALADTESLVTTEIERERTTLMRNMGLGPGDAVPPEIRREIKELEASEKGRLSRGKVDAVDRILLDLLALGRDLLALILATDEPLINEPFREALAAKAANLTAADAIFFVDTIETARTRVLRGVRPDLALEAAFATLVAGPKAQAS